MDEATLMRMAERARERDRDAQEMRYVQWPAKQSIERGVPPGSSSTSVVRPLSARKRDGSRRPVGVKFGLERIFVFKSLDATGEVFLRQQAEIGVKLIARAPV
jgi:hypothetical protein